MINFAPIFAQAYGQGAYSQSSYSSGSLQIGPLALPITGPTALALVSSILIAASAAAIVYLHQKRKKS